MITVITPLGEFVRFGSQDYSEFLAREFSLLGWELVSFTMFD